MTENVKKGNRNYCVTVLLMLLVTGITQPATHNTLSSQRQISVSDDEDHISDDASDSDEESDEDNDEDENNNAKAIASQKYFSIANKTHRITAIKIHGNKSASTEAILNHIPYKVGEMFDARKTRTLIRNLYYNLKRFRNIKVMGEVIDVTHMNLHIFVEEKYSLKEFKTVNNKKVSEKEIAKKINLDDIKTIDLEGLTLIAHKIKDIYLEKGYHQTTVETALQIDESNRATAILTIHEGAAATVKQIHFVGNNSISGKELRGVALTKEDWLFGFLDHSGNYHPDRLEADKHFIEQYYQNKGFLHAKVIDIDVNLDPQTQNIILTFDIEEGDQYTIDKISAPGTELVPEAFLLAMLPIRPGMPYSRDGVANAIKRLELIWGDYGYIFAHVEPSIDANEEEKTVSLSFTSELGDQVYLNKINIRGNKKTRDKTIRRKIILNEGELLTQSRMNLSKRNVASLGYFDPRDGVNWKIRRLNKEEADLDLIVKEGKTGHAGVQLGYGGAGADWKSPLSAVSMKVEYSDTNLRGSGIDVNLSATYSKEEQTALFHIAHPWLFDKPIIGALDIYHRRPVFDDLRHVETVHQRTTGGAVTFGCITQSKNQLFHDVNILFGTGVEDIRYSGQQIARFDNEFEREQYQKILDQEFRRGTYPFITTKLEQDTRNHPIHTMWGHKWRVATKFALPSSRKGIGYYKVELDASWFTPLISEYDLILKLHAFFGVTRPFENRVVPFEELFHIGGQTSVRGFLFGQIGPKFSGDTIGGSKAFFWNAELIAPITADMNMKAVVFYDGGTGFDNPYVTPADKPFVTSNNFDYRHAIGIGIRVLQPMPVNIDWGFKIDPRKDKLHPNRSESASELHFGMSYDW